MRPPAGVPPRACERWGAGGSFLYTFSADVEDPDRILSIEVWADRAALDEHMAHAHTAEFLRAVPGLVAGEPVMSLDDGP